MKSRTKSNEVEQSQTKLEQRQSRTMRAVGEQSRIKSKPSDEVKQIQKR